MPACYEDIELPRNSATGVVIGIAGAACALHRSGIIYDSQKDVWRSFNAQKQATLIAFHGKRETGRIAYLTDKAKIADLIASTNR